MKRIAITGAGGQIAYHLIFRIAHGDLLGPNVPIALHLLDLPDVEKSLEGLKMELQDCAFPLLKKIQIGSDPEKMFEEVDFALLVGAKPRGPGMERKDLLAANGKIFVSQGKALNKSASKDVKVLVIGNPCNTNCLIAMHHAPKIDRRQFFAMTRLDQNRAVFQLAEKANVKVEDVTNMAIWGNHSATQVPDFFHAKIRGHPAKEVITDKKWLEGEFIEIIQKRGATVIAARGKSSAASAANAIIGAVRSITTATHQEDWFSSGVISDNNPYGIQDGLIFSFPCKSQGKGDFEIVSSLKIPPFLQKKLEITQKELIEERDMVKNLL